MTTERRNIIILFLTLIVVMLGFGIIIPILPFYIEEFGAGGSELGLLMATFAVMQLIFAPIWGRLSDRVGRKPILIIGVFGNGVAQILFGLSTHLWMLFAARALSGILSSATLPTAMAYIGDSTSDRDRGGGMGVMGAAMGIGMVLGPGFGGWLAADSLSLPFFLAGGMSLLAMILIMLVLPESLPPEERVDNATQEQGASQWRLLRDALFGPIGFLLVLAFLLSFGITNFEAVFGLYALERFGYGTKQVGTVLTVLGLVSAIVQGMLTGRLTRRWGEATVIKVAFVGSAVGFLLMLRAEHMAGVLVTTGFFMVFNALLRPAVASLISIRATTGQGVAMGLNNSFMSMGRIVGPIWAGALFDTNLHYPYVSGSAIMLIGFIACLIWLRTDYSLSRQVA